MAVRTTEDDIRDVIDTDPTIDILPFQTRASVIVDRAVAKAAENNVTLSADEQEFMETYVAAHLYALRDPQPMKKRSGKSNVTFWGKSGKGLEMTPWGQTALSMDSSGALATVTGTEDGVKIVQAVWLGTDTTETT